MNQIKIGNFLRELRKEKGLTQEQLAEEMKDTLQKVADYTEAQNLKSMRIGILTMCI